MTLHENDWEVIVYQHLKLAYELLKRGVVLSWNQRNKMLGYENLPADYLKMIRKGLETERGYFAKDTITLDGCEYLEENRRMRDVRNYYNDPKRVGGAKLDRALEWVAEKLAKKLEALGA